MPRGDGRKPGEARPHRKYDDCPPQSQSRSLQRRIAGWESKNIERDHGGLQPYNDNNKHDGKGNLYRKPGSQKK